MKIEESTHKKPTHEYIVCYNRGEASKHDLNAEQGAEIVPQAFTYEYHPEEDPALKHVSPCQK